jgi:hypothetical protein
LHAQDARAATPSTFEAGISVLAIGGQVSPGLSLAVPMRHRERLRIHFELSGHRGARPILPACAGACPSPQPDQAFSLGTAGVRAERPLTARFIVVADAALVYGRWASDPAVSAFTSAASVGLGRESRRGRVAADLRLQWLDTPTSATPHAARPYGGRRGGCAYNEPFRADA